MVLDLIYNIAMEEFVSSKMNILFHQENMFVKCFIQYIRNMKSIPCLAY